MRDVLLARVRPLVERFAQDLAALAVERVEAELARIGVALDVALSAYQSDSSEVAADSDAAARDVLRDALGPELATMLDPPKTASGREAVRSRRTVVLEAEGFAERPPRPVPPTEAHSTDKRSANGKRWPSCKLCGKVGVTARTHPEHATLADRDHKPANTITGNEESSASVRADGQAARTPTSPTDDRRERIQRVNSARSGQPAVLGMRTTPREPAASSPAPTRKFGLPARPTTTKELQMREAFPSTAGTPVRWSQERITGETVKAEANKRSGELPSPRSSFLTIHTTESDVPGDLADVVEIGGTP